LTTAYAFWQFTAAVLLGAVLALVLDLGRGASRGLALRGAALQAADVLFWLLAGFAFSLGSYLLLGLTLRFYLVFGAGIGLLLYFGLASPVLLTLYTGIFRLVGTLLRLPAAFLGWGGRLLRRSSRRSGRDREP
jgi:hypothetical protein